MQALSSSSKLRHPHSRNSLVLAQDNQVPRQMMWAHSTAVAIA
jgi:hypothetical protein